MTNEVETPYLPNPRIMTKTLKTRKVTQITKTQYLLKKKDAVLKSCSVYYENQSSKKKKKGRKGKLTLVSKKLKLDIFKLNVEENIEKIEQDQYLQQVSEFL